ncbi:unnamed protein product, partial [Ilex paraguariensis]
NVQGKSPKRADDCKGKELLADLRISSAYVVMTKAIWIKCDPLPASALKLNVDGAAKGSSGLSGGGMINRDLEGHLLVAASSFYERGINTQVECMALLQGLKLIFRCNWESYQIYIESDSQILVQM